MALKTIVPPRLNLWTESYEANADLSAKQYTLVSPVAAATGKYKVGAPGGQGVLTCGVLVNTPTSGQQAEVQKLGCVQVKAAGAFNAGILLTCNDTTGTVAAAASGDYVIGMAGEGAAEANQLVKVELLSPPFQLN